MPLPVLSQRDKTKLQPSLRVGYPNRALRETFQNTDLLLSGIPMVAPSALLYLQEQSGFLRKDIPMACNPVGSLHEDSHHHHPALGLPGPSTLCKNRAVRDLQGPQGHAGSPSVSRGWDHIQLFADVGFPIGCSVLAVQLPSGPSSYIFRTILLPGSPSDGDRVKSGAWDQAVFSQLFHRCIFSVRKSLLSVPKQ